MAGGLWRDVGKGKAQAGNEARKAEQFKRVLKEDTVLLADIQAQLRKSHDEVQGERDTDHLHASELCKPNWCPRSSGYRILGTEPDQEELAPWNVSVYEEGNDIHDRYQRCLWQLGKLSGEWLCQACGFIWWDTSPQSCNECGSSWLKYLEVPVEDESIRLLGRGDGLVEEKLVEIKSIGLGSIRIEVPGLYRSYQNKELDINQLWQSIRRPFPSHLKQINLYLRALKLKTCVVLYEYKPNQAQKEFVVRYQPFIIQEIVAEAKDVVTALRDDSVVRRPEWADENHKVCKKCPYMKTCWRLTDGNVQGQEAPAQAERKVRVLRRV